MGDISPLNGRRRRQLKRRGHGGERGERWILPLTLVAFVFVIANSVLSAEITPPAGQAAVGQIGKSEGQESLGFWTYYGNCDAARAAGVAPLHVGEPGYREPLDADGDGIACEPYQGM